MAPPPDNGPARVDGRTPDQLRPVTITRGWLDHAEGSVLVEFGKTRVLCAASFTAGVPRWRKGSGLGWVTAEYAMLPRSTNTRSDRESVKGRIGGRTHEISRLVGRSLRAVIDTKALGENTIVLDCDVLQADGGTRTAAITGAYVALADAVEDARRKGLVAAGAKPLTGSVAAVSVGVVQGAPVLDLCYEEDVTADTDMNIVMTGDGRFVEVQGTAEGEAFDRQLLDALLDLGGVGCAELTRLQQQALEGAAVSAPEGARLVLATHNEHKVVELREILADVVRDRGVDVDLDRAVVGVDAFDGVEEPVEDGDTFAANALIKARAVSAATGLPALADDSGLAVDVMGGSPGIFSARWSGRTDLPRAEKDRANLELLLAQLSDVLDEHRAAGFVCAAALVTPDGREHVEHGEVRGVLERAPRGTNGFGYDPLLRLDDGRTLAELSNAEKNAISHRGNALRAIAPLVVDLLVG